MHLLSCPDCQVSISVTPSQAGAQVPCPGCSKSVDVPMLGKLRQLPLAEPDSGSMPVAAESSRGGSMGFLVLGLIATAALVIAVFSGIRWGLIEVPMTTEGHLAELSKAYQEIPPAQLIREFEQMEEFGIDAGAPYGYKKIENQKTEWGRNAMIAGAISLLSAAGAIGLASVGRK